MSNLFWMHIINSIDSIDVIYSEFFLLFPVEKFYFMESKNDEI